MVVVVVVVEEGSGRGEGHGNFPAVWGAGGGGETGGNVAVVAPVRVQAWSLDTCSRYTYVSQAAFLTFF